MKLTIITINYNNAEGLRKTLASVAPQTYADIEHIIVDGGSTDGSVEIIREYADNEAIRLQGYTAIRQEKNGKADDALPNRPIASSPHRHEIRWISEPDKGIYNAMNKGIEIALGKRIVNDDHTSQPILNLSLEGRTSEQGNNALSFREESEVGLSFAKVWGAHTADSTQYDLLKKNAEANRKNPTEAESVMWDMLKGNKLGAHFRRQHIILDYIVDFICIDKGLVIELDGGYHNDPQQKEYDEQRTAHLQQLGYTELRFKNEELLCNPDSVIAKITETLNTLPSFQGRAGDRLYSLPFREESEVGLHYIQILNSGDILAAADVTERMFQAMGNRQWAIENDSNHQSPIANRPTSDSAPASSPLASRLSPIENGPAIFYGNMIKESPDGRRTKDTCGGGDYTPESFLYFYKGTLNHDCAYIRRDLFEKYGLYNEQMKICSDWEWYVRAIVLGGEKTVYTNIDVTIFDMTGISESGGKNKELILNERREYLESIIPAVVLRDYDKYAFPISQYQRLKKYHLWGIVYFMERVLFKFEKWFNKG